MLSLPSNQLFALSALALLGGTFDLRERRIPNWITIPGLVTGLTLNCLPGHPGLQFGLTGLLIAAAVYVPLYLIRGMGAGDVKLMAAIGAIVGPENWVLIFLATAVIGGVAALLLVVQRGRYYETFFNVSLLVSDILHFRAPYKDSSSLDVRNPNALRLPHGVSIACGTFTALMLAHLHFV